MLNTAGYSSVDECGTTRYFGVRELHREDGPAVEYISGEKEWWYHGEQIHVTTQEEFERYINLIAFK